MEIPFEQRVVVPESILFSKLDELSALLNLETEFYYGLDEVGTRFWVLLGQSASIQEAYETMLAEYDVTPEQLKADLHTLIAELVEHGLVQVEDA